mgnify:CR=1 FL=1|jgi:hypothetical protein
MTIGATGGHSNLTQNNFIAQIYSKDVQKFFRRVAVVQDITNTDYFGEIANYGDTVRIIKEPTITIADYTRGLALETQDLVDDEITLTVDQAKYFQFAVDDVEAKVAHHNWTELAIGSAAYTIRDDYDSTILTYMKGQAPSGNTIGSDSATSTGDITSTSAAMDLGYGAGEVSPLRFMARAARQLDDQNVPDDNRWFVADPDFWEIMADENSKILDSRYSHDSDSKLRNGRVTEGIIRGFRCYKSNNLPSATSATNLSLFGHMSSTATASQIAKTEVIRSEFSFADKTRGLHLYGRKTLRTTALGVGYYVID